MTSFLVPSSCARRGLPSVSRHLVALALTLGAAFGAHAEDTKVRFTLDWRIDGPGAIVLLAKAKGYFAQEKLDVVVDAGSGSTAALQRIALGTHDIGFADTAALVEFSANNPTAPKVQAVYMLMEKTPAAVFALKSSGVKVPADLAGKTLGAPVFDAGRKAWPLFAKANKIDPASVTWSNVDPALRETLLIKKDIGAITGFYYTSLLNLEARGVKADELTVFRYADHGVNLYGNAVVVSARFAAEHPQAIAGFLRALNRSIVETIADPKAAIVFVKEREPILDAAVEERRLRYFVDNFVATPTVKAQGLGDVDTARLRLNIVQIVEAFGLKTYPDADNIFNRSFLPPAAQRKL